MVKSNQPVHLACLLLLLAIPGVFLDQFAMELSSTSSSTEDRGISIKTYTNGDYVLLSQFESGFIVSLLSNKGVRLNHAFKSYFVNPLYLEILESNWSANNFIVGATLSDNIYLFKFTEQLKLDWVSRVTAGSSV